jgi:hypothetical protein
MNKDLIEQVFERPDASAGTDLRGADVTVVPRLAFVDDDGNRVDWLDDVENVKVWMCEVHGRAHVSQVNRVVISAFSKPLHSDALTDGSRKFRRHTVNLAPGTIVQGGISLTMKNGWRTVIAAVGIVPKIEEVDLDDDALIDVPFVDDCAVTAGKSRTHQISVALHGVRPLLPEDAALLSNQRHDVENHGEAKVRASLDLVTSE